MARFTLSRRTILRGAAGASVALPPLEVMYPGKARAAESAIPNRFLLAWGGVSLGAYVPHDQTLIVPKTTGPSYEKTRGLAPIFDQTYTGNVTGPVNNLAGIVSGMTIPGGDPVPPAGRFATAADPIPVFHGCTTMQQVAGERCLMKDQIGAGRYWPYGSSADQVVADTIKGPAAFAVLNLRAQASRYYDSDHGDVYTMSYRAGNWVQEMIDPRYVYDTLFGGGRVNGKTFDVAAFIDRKKSVLDAVLEKSNRLLSRLGNADKARIDKYYAEVRSLETSLERLKTTSGNMACRPASAPPDFPIADGYFPGSDEVKVGKYKSPDSGWSNEELRAQLMCDFLHLAFACDLARSATLHLTMSQSYMNAAHIIPSQNTCDLHTVGHGGGDIGDMADIVAWHVKHFSRLAAKLHATEDGVGGRLLDHCAMSMLWEGGHGDTGYAHSTENMIAIVAGGAGGLKSGQHVGLKGNTHPGQVVLTHMRAVGVPETQPFGDLTDSLPELFRVSA